ncbi:MFS transporter [uncultured Methylobacterium sp.]|uniref:MFS transporter n=1 Tax=uncultured Methylobacterium sp. TaxID=157278 RepID=UPI002630753A|nr:MFS transporter [uncultured Methylobacterium sp.]
MVGWSLPARATPARLGPLVPFFCLAVTFGTTLGFLASGAPLILRVRGIELAQVGLLQLINLPVGLTFLWAVVVDRVRLPGLPHRIGWIAVMQAAGIALLVLLSAGEHWPLAALFGLAVATSLCVATMDVALEALVVETVPTQSRTDVAAAKFCGASLGGILGAGVLVARYDVLGWHAALLVVAGLNLACLLPILRYPEARLRRARPADTGAPGTARFGRLRALASRIAVLGGYFAALSLLGGFNNLALLDLGLPLAQVGLVTGTASPLIGLVMAALSGALVRRFGTVPLITVSAIGAVAAGGAMAAASLAGSVPLAVAATLFGLVCGGGLGVPVFAMIYRWAQGPLPATDYALLFGAAFFAAMPVRVAAPALAGALGWAGYFVLAVAAYALAFAVLRRTIARTLAADREAGAA